MMPRRFVLLLSLVAPLPAATAEKSAPAVLRGALTFHASFDTTADADFARGDRRVFTAVDSGKRAAATPGLPAPNLARLAPDAGRFGGALQFGGATKHQVFDRELTPAEARAVFALPRGIATLLHQKP